MAVLNIVAAVLLPPFGAYMARGFGRDFWIAVVLTLVAFLPGMLYALYLVLGDRQRAMA